MTRIVPHWRRGLWYACLRRVRSEFERRERERERWKLRWDWCGGFRRNTQKPLSLHFSALCLTTPPISSLKSISLSRSLSLSSIFIPFNSITIITLSLNRVKDNFGWRMNVVSRFAFPTSFMNCWWQKQVLCDVECGKEFILCEYNRDADSYRLIFVTIAISALCWIQYA